MLASRARRVVAVLATAGLLTVAACGGDTEPVKPKPSAAPAAPVLLTFAVYGPPPVITAYTKIAAAFTAAHPKTVVNVRPYDTHAEAMAALATQTANGNQPDLFLMDRDDLPGLLERKATVRLDELLGERQVDFGDGYMRDGLEAFSADSALRCMPADVSPLVVYYNTKLVDLTQLADPGRKEVTAETGWSLEEFAKAAQLATRPGTKGLYVAPDLEQLAPFIWSGGGQLVDNTAKPTSLTLASDNSESALEKLLEVVRNPETTYDQAQLQRRSALERFKAGRLGMILGSRELTPQLRAQQDLSFDVMPLPKIGSAATVGTMSGLCISNGIEHTSRTADFLTYVASSDAAKILAETGYVVPPNLDVVNGESFLQPGLQPENASVFPARVRDVQSLPESVAWPAVRAAAAPLLTALFFDPVIEPLKDRLQAIDEGSKALFVPTPSPSASPSASPSGSS